MQCSKAIRSSASGLPSTGFQLERLRVFEGRPSTDHVDAAFFAKLLQSAGQGGDYLFLAGAHGVQFDLGRGEGNAPIAKMFGLGHGFGHVQQGFRGDATAQQADAAEAGFEIDEGDLQPEVGSQEGGGIAARTPAEDAKLSVHGVISPAAACLAIGGSRSRR